MSFEFMRKVCSKFTSEDEILGEFVYRLNVKCASRTRQFEPLFIGHVNDVNAKLAFLASSDIINELTSKHGLKTTTLKEEFEPFKLPVGFAINLGSFMFDHIEDVMQWLVTAGIVQHSYEFHRWVLLKEVPELESGPVVLTLELLSHGFLLWLVSLGVAVLVYFYELLKFKMKRPLRNLVGKWLFLTLLKQRLPFYRT